ncbi:MAG: diguanylate cyclase [Syntrophobacteraceae bacterium]
MTDNVCLENRMEEGRTIQESRAGHLIYLVEDDPLQAKVLSSQISYFGYSVRIFYTLADMKCAIVEMLPNAILMDVIFPEGKKAGIEAIAEMRKTLIPSVPVLFISTNDDPLCRLQAVRSGGAGYFTKPVDVGMLIDALDRLLFNAPDACYRVLIVDDSYVQANVNAMHLTRAGMKTTIAIEPLEALPILKDFNPDLILMDVYMPDCSGIELARVIRQIEAYLSIPIVFLSSETDRERQLEAFGIGGDDFLVKPIKPDHLVAAVASRAERYRKLRALMLHDGLTGLLNHTTTKERLRQETARAHRRGSQLSLALIDLDNFKSINDTHGHTAGDRVLKSLAQLLVRRLRASDIVGRYGGEEFAVILPNTGLADAARLMDDLRMSFEKVRHRASGAEFSATFSCGVSGFPQCAMPASLTEAADKAMYTAKARGRNQVCSL